MSKNPDYSKIDEIVSLYRPAPINSHLKSAYNIDINRYRYRYVYVVIINYGTRSPQILQKQNPS